MGHWRIFHLHVTGWGALVLLRVDHHAFAALSAPCFSTSPSAEGGTLLAGLEVFSLVISDIVT